MVVLSIARDYKEVSKNLFSAMENQVDFLQNVELEHSREPAGSLQPLSLMTKRSVLWTLPQCWA